MTRAWSTACPDWQERLVGRRSIIPAPIFASEAQAGLEVMGDLRLVDVPGQPRFGDCAPPWQLDLAAALLGSLDPETGRRLISEFMLLVSKKNAKSGLAALLMLTVAIRTWRRESELGIVAPTISVADNSYAPLRAAIKADPELSQLFHVQDHRRTVRNRANGVTLQVIAADSQTAAGKKFSGVLIDELWLFGKNPRAADLMREITGGLAARPEGFVVTLTTMSDEPPAGVFKEKLEYARGVRDGRIVDSSFLPVLYEMPAAMLENGEARKLENFYITNPSLGYSVDPPFLERELKKATEAGPAALAGFLAKHANIEVGLALQSSTWSAAERWEQASDRDLTLDELLARSEVVTVGIDLGGLDDMGAVAALGRDRETGAWLAWCRAWLFKGAVEVRKSNATVYEGFERDGDLVIVQQVGEDLDGIVEVVERVQQSGLLDKVGADPHGTPELLDRLLALGLEAGRDVVGVSQGWRLFPAITTVERKLAEGSLAHAGQPLMSWAMGNAKVEVRGNAKAIQKSAAGVAKIDPVIALLCAVHVMNLNPQARDLAGFFAAPVVVAM